MKRPLALRSPIRSRWLKVLRSIRGLPDENKRGGMTVLEEIMQHQENFTLSKGPGAGMIQVS